MAEIKHLHALSAHSMLSNSYIWLHQPEIVQALDGDALGRGALAKIQDAHSDLVNALAWQRQAGTSLADLTRRITEQGRIYDRLVRAIHGGLTAFADGAEHPDEADRYLAVRNLLLPIGLAITKQSYAQEHGAVVHVATNMTPDLEDFLRQHMVGTRSLWALYERWLAAGNALGQMIKARARLSAARKRDAEARPMNVHEARQAWMRVVRIFIGATGILSLSDEVRRLIFAPLRRDIADALEARRQRLDRAAGADSDADADADADDADADADADDADADANADADSKPLREPAVAARAPKPTVSEVTVRGSPSVNAGRPQTARRQPAPTARRESVKGRGPAGT